MPIWCKVSPLCALSLSLSQVHGLSPSICSNYVTYINTHIYITQIYKYDLHILLLVCICLGWSLGTTVNFVLFSLILGVFHTCIWNMFTSPPQTSPTVFLSTFPFLPSQLSVLFFILLGSSLCCPTSLGCGGRSCWVVNLGKVTLLRNLTLLTKATKCNVSSASNGLHGDNPPPCRDCIWLELKRLSVYRFSCMLI